MRAVSSVKGGTGGFVVDAIVNILESKNVVRAIAFQDLQLNK